MGLAFGEVQDNYFLIVSNQTDISPPAAHVYPGVTSFPGMQMFLSAHDKILPDSVHPAYEIGSDHAVVTAETAASNIDQC